jgi:hypothetical protein
MSTNTWHLAQYNVAWLLAPLDDPKLDDFRADLDRINGIGDRSPGFVWRHKAADGNSTSVRVRNDPRILINFTVWESVDALFEYTFRSNHAVVYRRRTEWFAHLEEPWAVLWWIPAGHEPTVEEGEERLRYLTKHGASEHAFSFKQRFEPPSGSGRAAP